jgi:bifunctional DNA-binding transcriptional regulator/antitoxin component of YhaV-PrlF toxin-antitoxin module
LTRAFGRATCCQEWHRGKASHARAPREDRPGGRIVVPAEFRRALGVDIGDDVVIELTNGELRLRSLDAAIKRAQEIVRKHVPEGVSLADELIRERREEAGREENA